MAGFLLTALVGRRLYTRAWIIAVPVIMVTWLIGDLSRLPDALRAAPSATRACTSRSQWIPAGNFDVAFNLAVDDLTAVLLIVVTTVGMLVHVYSIGYMAHDASRWRFFAYLNLFMFSMLLLVLADNFLLLFAAWELVGLSSYLLIGFWYTRAARRRSRPRRRSWSTASATSASRSASWPSGPPSARSTSTQVVTLHCRRRSDAGTIAPWMMAGIALLLFCGAVGKSAQFPLHVWLPDAMEGPTPVSALIHAATMVNAGVYLVARAQPDLRARTGGHVRGRRDRHLHRHPGRLDRVHPEGHQARAGLLHAVASWATCSRRSASAPSSRPSSTS